MLKPLFKLLLVPSKAWIALLLLVWLQVLIVLRQAGIRLLLLVLLLA